MSSQSDASNSGGKKPPLSFQLEELAGALDARVQGDGGLLIHGVSTIQNGKPGTITFLANPRYKKFLQDTDAGAVILTEDLAEDCPVPAIVCTNPYAGYARVSQMFEPTPSVGPGVHPLAHVAPTAIIGEGVTLEAGAVVQDGAEIGDEVYVGPNCVVGERVRVGAGSKLVASVTLVHDVIVGQRCLLHPGAVVGADGFGQAFDGERWEKIAQLGTAILGDDVEVGANTTIDRGAIDDTVVGNGVKLDNLIQIGHNVRVGAHTAIAAQVTLAGSAVVGKRCSISVNALVLGHLELVDDVHITPFSMVTKSISEPGVYSSGIPVEPNKSWRKNQARFHELDSLVRRVRALEGELKKLSVDRDES
ncbi:MAG: UDP-3-O-(3-hydroxymyristoyl)glucosamine N-acyltransferase [Gammaproteobacteria bacterium]